MPTLRRNNLAHRRLQAAKVIMVDILAAHDDLRIQFPRWPGRGALEVSGHDDPVPLMMLLCTGKAVTSCG
jgi:hypothetical protein